MIGLAFSMLPYVKGPPKALPLVGYELHYEVK